MSIENSPQNPSRLKKISGRRVQINIYLPKSEVDELDKLREETGLSRASLITQRYFQGKAAQTGVVSHDS